jgi:HAD superfamily hydrolase (TIGR01509 family)
MPENYTVCFDLDGTLVKTDDIYFIVWKTILQHYNINLDINVYNDYIYGNSDEYVKNVLLKNIDISLNALKEAKDSEFIKHISSIKIIDGSINFIEKLKNKKYNVCIVTNCNKLVADTIIEYMNISSNIDLLITSDDCQLKKPDPYPYQKAMQYFNSSPRNTIIFEDSKTGLLSAINSKAHIVVGITSNYMEDELLDIGADSTIDDYNNVDIDYLVENNNKNINITKHLSSKYTNVILDTKLKGGFIADIYSISAKYNGKIKNMVFKIHSHSKTDLEKMAQKLDLYERENYFYDSISRYINIPIPKFYGLVKDDSLYNVGILLENMNYRNGFKIGLNLNSECVDVSLQILKNMAKMHSKFWNKDLSRSFPRLHKNNSDIFSPFMSDFIQSKKNIFINKWKNVLTPCQINKCNDIIDNFDNIQHYLSNNNLTLVHGDIKSANIYFDTINNNTPYFIDWQHCVNGKGAQDLVFFLTESFSIENINNYKDLFILYYYRKLIDFGVTNYTYDELLEDVRYSIKFIPVFTSIWFGCVSSDELIDKNWPFFFIQKVFYLLDNL